MKLNYICENCPHPENLECFGGDIEKCDIKKDELIGQIKDALRELYENEYYLIQNEVNEVCIVAHFWRYFLNKYHEKYDSFEIDMEYNRNGKWAKYYGISHEHCKLYAKPDFIIHKRGCNYHNFVCIEFKGHWNRAARENQNDEEKLKAFTKTDILFDYDGRKYSYKYRYGIRLKLNRESVEFKWFENGEHVDEYDFLWRIQRG